jgi:anti-sigma B factor antagonist
VDLGETTATDATGVGVLVLLQKRARERGLSIRLLRVPPRLWNLLQATRLDLLFPTAARLR